MKHSVKPVRLSPAVLACLICVITATIWNTHQAPRVGTFSSAASPPPRSSPLFTPDFWFHRLSGTVAVGSASATHKPLQRPCLRAVWMLCDSACGHIAGFFFPSLLRLQDFEAESGEPAMISTLTPLFFPITPPFLLHFKLRDAAALRAHPSSSRAVNKPPLATPPNMCEVHLFLPFLLLSVQLCLEEHVSPSCLTSCQEMWRLKRWITLRKTCVNRTYTDYVCLFPMTASHQWRYSQACSCFYTEVPQTLLRPR